VEQESIRPTQNRALPDVRNEDVFGAVTLFIPHLGEDADDPELILYSRIPLAKTKEPVKTDGLS
jgi:hypothetical protein